MSLMGLNSARRAAAACAEAVVPCLGPSEQEGAREDIALVLEPTHPLVDGSRRSALGRALAARERFGVRDIGRRTPEGWGQEAVWALLKAATATEPNELHRAVQDVGRASARIEVAGGGCAPLAPLVRAHVPLPVVLLAIAGVSTSPALLGF